MWILRHAKAAAEPPAGGRDRDRPLTARGRRDAAALGARLAAGGLMPGVPSGGSSAEPETVLAYVREVDGDPAAVLVVGHNPTVSHLAHDLASDASPGRDRLGSHGLATCSLAVVDLAVAAWEDVAAGLGTLVGLFAPPY